MNVRYFDSVDTRARRYGCSLALRRESRSPDSIYERLCLCWRAFRIWLVVDVETAH